MRNNSIIPIASMLLFVLILTSCQKEELCSEEVIFRDNQACGSSDNTALVETLSDGEYILLTNFSSFAQLDDFENGDVFSIEYSDPDYTDVDSGLLCGPLIVAPTASISCLSQD